MTDRCREWAGFTVGTYNVVAVTASLDVGTVSAAAGARLVRTVGTGHGRAGEEESSDDGGELHDC